ncbi:TOMM precursor leader peptide-binding protein [Streptomyces sp. Je 1-332]|uniref:TOMM precursor leader peptide-binding protein n=1 Tax=Streptomyces sp. Je 1-332 TaxID=3231270 RepID=UPI003457896D
MTSMGGQQVWPAAGDETARVGFKLHLHPVVVPGEAAYLVSRRGVTALRGEFAERLVPLLDGTRDLGGVLREAAPELDPGDVLSSLRELKTAGLLRFHPEAGPPTLTGGPLPPVDRAAEAYWDLAGLDGGLTVSTLRRTTVRIEALTGTEVDLEAVAAACHDSGVTVMPEGGDADLSLVLCDDYLSPQLREVDAVHRAQGKPWLIAKVCGVEPWVGPVFRPDDGPCWSCLASRLAGHRHSEWPVRRALGIEGPLTRPTASLGAGRAIAVNIAVLEVAKWIAGIRYDSQGDLHTLDTLHLRARPHRVARIPQCDVCGDPGLVAERIGRPFAPVSRPKAAPTAGGHRALTPEQMLARHSHLVDPVTGIIKDIRRAPRSPEGINSYLSGSNLAMGPHTLAGLRAGLRALSGGKGLTQAEGRVSALCEAVERYSGTRHGDEPVVWDTFRALGAEAVHPHACQLYDERQFRDRDRWNARLSGFQHVPEPFDENRPTQWTPVWSLTSGTRRFLPTSMLYFSRGEPAADGLYADSNGNAAGSSPEDALVQGFLEIVERDAVALWWYNRIRRPAVDIEAFDEPCVERMRSVCTRLNRDLWVLDLTSDMGIPVMVALSRRTDKPAEDVIFGFGAHFDPRVALRRALTEMGQLVPAVCEARADGTGYGLTDPEPLAWWQHATVGNQPYLLPDPALPPRAPGHWPYVPRADLLDDVTAITGLVEQHGMELLVLDQTRPDLDVPVVKVVVPGMRHFWARFAPGRLFDVPVAQGRLAAPTSYEGLNPIPLFV